jgi:hypothetical protein
MQIIGLHHARRGLCILYLFLYLVVTNLTSQYNLSISQSKDPILGAFWTFVMLCADCKTFLGFTEAQLIDYCSYDVLLQLAKLAGNKVVATCGGQDKAELLQSLGADRVIDYKKETIKSVNEESNLTSKVLIFFGPLDLTNCCLYLLEHVAQRVELPVV